MSRHVLAVADGMSEACKSSAKMRAGEMAQATCLAVAFLPGFLRGRQVTVHGLFGHETRG